MQAVQEVAVHEGVREFADMLGHSPVFSWGGPPMLWALRTFGHEHLLVTPIFPIPNLEVVEQIAESWRGRTDDEEVPTHGILLTAEGEDLRGGSEAIVREFVAMTSDASLHVYRHWKDDDVVEEYDSINGEETQGMAAIRTLSAAVWPVNN